MVKKNKYSHTAFYLALLTDRQTNNTEDTTFLSEETVHNVEPKCKETVEPLTNIQILSLLCYHLPINLIGFYAFYPIIFRL